ncbi:hypothetical protein ACJX0J_012134, partial [Zea mays]
PPTFLLVYRFFFLTVFNFTFCFCLVALVNFLLNPHLNSIQDIWIDSLAFGLLSVIFEQINSCILAAIAHIKLPHEHITTVLIGLGLLNLCSIFITKIFIFFTNFEEYKEKKYRKLILLFKLDAPLPNATNGVEEVALLGSTRQEETGKEEAMGTCLKQWKFGWKDQ